MSTETASGSQSGSTSSSVNLESVRAVAKKDFQDAVRSWMFWGLSIFFFLLLVGVTGALSYFGADVSPTQAETTGALVSLVSEISRLIIPLIALVLGWKSIAGERESGSIKVLLSLPHSRKDVLLGKLLGRSAVLSLSLVVGFVLAAVVVAAILGSFDPVDYFSLLVMTIIYGVAYTSIAVALSSITRSTTIAGAAMVSVFLTFYIVWNALQTVFQILMRRGTIEGVSFTREIPTQNGVQEMPGERLPDWALFIDTIDPGTAFQNAITVLSSAGGELGTAYPEYYFSGGVPFYLENWFSFIILLGWIVVPIAIALWRFDRVDL
ncbi:ABC-2 type transporter [Haloterrigena turkmenica DSM 5511]|uniref:ABC-2 type transporter n=1 Tax=Haloterrigena turkmenica (strain ATCC 51198 / DSM 5511 / JCM 9101 / NCIMB 13204 / VKM B-1734 / 4k) TaxID=543526 RepID=D2RRA9_HALTV|nr:ABC transporter permease [Haloterrigena turkmenica]ADB62505.1 ABC-2 type transporter [Haloterrigena turkmenica DSM 5511]